MTAVAVALLAAPALVVLYAYAGYPVLLGLFSFATRRSQRRDPEADEWPHLSVSLPAYNEENSIRGALEALLQADYPRDRLQIVVVSDASTDGTDEIVQEYADRGVELVRLEERGGKTAAENAAVPHLEGDIVVNTDASVRVRPGALRALARPFSDPSVGVTSGRDRSVSGEGGEADAGAGEAGYVGYEMWVRSLESRLGGIVGASGCLYAIRRELHVDPVPEHLSRDFTAALRARERGYRALSANDAVCLVPRTGSLSSEFRRKVRTITRGLQTLLAHRGLLNPIRHGRFAWKLWSHKAARWLGAATAPLAIVGLSILALESTVALAALIAVGGSLAAALVSFRSPAAADIPGPVRACGYLYAANAAAALACWRALRRERDATWEPTRR